MIGNKYFSLLIIFLIALGSSSGQTNARDYYFPLGSVKETKVYKYVDRLDPQNTVYWEVISDPSKGELITVVYNFNLEKLNSSTERIHSGGADLIGTFFFEKNWLGRWVENPVKVIENKVHRWNGEKSYYYVIEYKNELGKIRSKKTRTELGRESITVNDKDHLALKFKGEYEIQYLDHDQTISAYRYSYYAKDIGLVKSVSYYFDEIVILELDKIMSKTEFAALILESKKTK